MIIWNWRSWGLGMGRKGCWTVLEWMVLCRQGGDVAGGTPGTDGWTSVRHESE